MYIFCENMEDIYVGIEWEVGMLEVEKFYCFLYDEMGVVKVCFFEFFLFGVKLVFKEGMECLVCVVCKYVLEYGLLLVMLVYKGNIMKFIEGGFKKWGYELVECEFGDVIVLGKLVIKDCIVDVFL